MCSLGSKLPYTLLKISIPLVGALETVERDISSTAVTEWKSVEIHQQSTVTRINRRIIVNVAMNIVCLV